MSDSPDIAAARSEVDRRRARMMSTAHELQLRLSPGTLAKGAWQGAKEKGADLAVDGLNRLAHALAAPAALVSVPQLDGFVNARRCPRRNRRPAHAPVLERDVHLHGRIAPAVEDLAGMDIDDCSHGFPSCASVTI